MKFHEHISNFKTDKEKIVNAWRNKIY
jgi:hypothetical protein